MAFTSIFLRLILSYNCFSYAKEQRDCSYKDSVSVLMLTDLPLRRCRVIRYEIHQVDRYKILNLVKFLKK